MWRGETHFSLPFLIFFYLSNLAPLWWIKQTWTESEKQTLSETRDEGLSLANWLLVSPPGSFMCFVRTVGAPSAMGACVNGPEIPRHSRRDPRAVSEMLAPWFGPIRDGWGPYPRPSPGAAAEQLLQSPSLVTMEPTSLDTTSWAVSPEPQRCLCWRTACWAPGIHAPGGPLDFCLEEPEPEGSSSQTRAW